MGAAVNADPSLISWVIAALLMCGLHRKVRAVFRCMSGLPDAMAGPPLQFSAPDSRGKQWSLPVFYFLIRIAFLFPEIGALVALPFSARRFAVLCRLLRVWSE